MDKFVVAIKKDNKQNDLLHMLLEANSHRQVGFVVQMIFLCVVYLLIYCILFYYC